MAFLRSADVMAPRPRLGAGHVASIGKGLARRDKETPPDAKSL